MTDSAKGSKLIFGALAAICFAKELNREVAAFIGAVAAAMDVQIVGNKQTVGKVNLQKYITALLKWRYELWQILEQIL